MSREGNPDLERCLGSYVLSMDGRKKSRVGMVCLMIGSAHDHGGGERKERGTGKGQR